MRHFIELTILSDSADTLSIPRLAMLRVDQITSVVDVSEANYATGVKTMILTEEPFDFLNEDDETGGVVRAARIVYVRNFYTEVRSKISAAS